MPLPLALLATLGVAAAGVKANMSAKEKNETAQMIADEAKELYDDAKEKLDLAQKNTERSVIKLGNSKKKVLETSINQFLVAYDRIKNIELSQSAGMNELSKLCIDKQDALQLREMTDIYQSAFSSTAAGVVAAVTVSGFVPMLTAAVSPLAVVAAPIVLFNGISANKKAEENLEKAKVMYAEAEAAAEKMKTSAVMCKAIGDRADMFDDLLGELNEMFAYCTDLLDGVTRKKIGLFKKKVDARTLTKEELELVAITRALAGAVKAVIDTPILSSGGEVTQESKVVHEKTRQQLPALCSAVEDVRTNTYDTAPVSQRVTAKPMKVKKKTEFWRTVGNITALGIGIFMMWFCLNWWETDIQTAVLGFTIGVLSTMSFVSKGFFKHLKNACCVYIAGYFCYIFYLFCPDFVGTDGYILTSIITIVVSFLVWCFAIGSDHWNLIKTLARVAGCVMLGAGSVLLYAFLYELLGLSGGFSLIITVILYGIGNLIAVYFPD